jgi:hypothetical protein
MCRARSPPRRHRARGPTCRTPRAARRRRRPAQPRARQAGRATTRRSGGSSSLARRRRAPPSKVRPRPAWTPRASHPTPPPLPSPAFFDPAPRPHPLPCQPAARRRSSTMSTSSWGCAPGRGLEGGGGEGGGGGGMWGSGRGRGAGLQRQLRRGAAAAPLCCPLVPRQHPVAQPPAQAGAVTIPYACALGGWASIGLVLFPLGVVFAYTGLVVLRCCALVDARRAGAAGGGGGEAGPAGAKARGGGSGEVVGSGGGSGGGQAAAAAPAGYEDVAEAAFGPAARRLVSGLMYAELVRWGGCWGGGAGQVQLAWPSTIRAAGCHAKAQASGSPPPPAVVARQPPPPPRRPLTWPPPPSAGSSASASCTWCSRQRPWLPSWPAPASAPRSRRRPRPVARARMCCSRRH